MYRTVVRSARQFLKAVPRAGSVVTLTNRVPVAFGRRWCGGVVAAGTLVGGAVTVAACDASYSVADAPIKVRPSVGVEVVWGCCTAEPMHSLATWGLET